MKYIMFKKDIGTKSTHYVPVIFPDFLVHADVAAAMKHEPQLRFYKVHSAGFLSPLDLVPCGESESLGVKSDPEDRERIQYNDYGMSFS